MKNNERAPIDDCLCILFGAIIGFVLTFTVTMCVVDSYYSVILRDDNKIEQWREIDEAQKRIEKGIE